MTEGTSDWKEEAFKEADQMEIDRLRGNAEVSKIISAGKNSYEEIDYNGVKIKFTPFISRPVRRRLAKVETSDQDSAEDAIYLSLSLLCKEDPWNKPLTWKLIEADGGDASELLTRIMSRIKERAAQMADFQPNKRSATATKPV